MSGVLLKKRLRLPRREVLWGSLKKCKRSPGCRLNVLRSRWMTKSVGDDPEVAFLQNPEKPGKLINPEIGKKWKSDK